MPILDILKNVVTDAGAKLVKSVGDAFNQNFTTKEEKLAKLNELQQLINDNNQKIIELAQKADQMYLTDVSDARNQNIHVQESANASWLSKNVGPIMALGTIILAFILFYIFAFQKPANMEKDIVIYILGILSAILVQIYSFQFGSSKGSSDKGRQIEKLLTDKEPRP